MYIYPYIYIYIYSSFCNLPSKFNLLQFTREACTPFFISLSRTLSLYVHARIHTEPKPVVMRSLLYILYYSCILTVRTKFSRVLRHYLSLFFPPSLSSISGHKLVPDVDGVCIMYYIFGMYIVCLLSFFFSLFYPLLLI